MKGRPVKLDLPVLNTSADVAEATAIVAREMAAGELTPDEAAGVTAVLEAKRRAIETTELEARIKALEEAQGR
jgi:hypothetical protein